MYSGFIIPVLKLVYCNLLYPTALSFVRSTDNDYDDKTLKFLDDVVNDILFGAGSISTVKNGKTDISN